jgi:hypothetical protein
MKTKEELLGDYREMVEQNTLHKDVVFLEVLIDIRDALVAVEQQIGTLNDQSIAVRRKTRDRQSESRHWQ